MGSNTNIPFTGEGGVGADTATHKPSQAGSFWDRLRVAIGVGLRNVNPSTRLPGMVLAPGSRSQNQGNSRALDPRRVEDINNWVAFTENAKGVLQDMVRQGVISQGQMQAMYNTLTRNRPANWTIAQAESWLSNKINGYVRDFQTNNPAPGLEGLLGDLLDGLFGDGGLGGSGGGVGPVYVAPDRRAVEDSVTGMLVNLTGRADKSQVEKLTNLYMSEDRRGFNSKNAQVDPGMSVLESIRASAEYKRIHALRPDQEDERTWISSRRSAAEAAGLAVDALDDFAIEAATGAWTEQDSRGGAAVRQFQTSGRMPSFLATEASQVIGVMAQRMAR